MSTHTKQSLIEAGITILIGLLFLIMKQEVISVALTLLGVGLIFWAILSFLSRDYWWGALKAVGGILIICAGWFLVTVAVYIFGGLLLVYGLYQLIGDLCVKMHGTGKFTTILLYAEPVLEVVVGLLLLLRQDATLDWIFSLSGVLIIINGILSLFNDFLPYGKH